jgi:hypothetical protein
MSMIDVERKIKILSETTVSLNEDRDFWAYKEFFERRTNFLSKRVINIRTRTVK